MICPHCGHPDSKCLKTEKIEEAGFDASVTRRRRRCLCGIRNRICEERFTTYEVTAQDFDILKAAKKSSRTFEPSGLISNIEESDKPAGKTSKLTVKPRKKK